MKPIEALKTEYKRIYEKNLCFSDKELVESRYAAMRQFALNCNIVSFKDIEKMEYLVKEDSKEVRTVTWFFVGQDIQVQINNDCKKWFDRNGKLDIVYLFDELGEGELIQANEINVSADGHLWAADGELYEWNSSDIKQMGKTGFSRMYHIGKIADCVDIESDNDLEFVKWYYALKDKKSAANLIAKSKTTV